MDRSMLDTPVRLYAASLFSLEAFIITITIIMLP